MSDGTDHSLDQRVPDHRPGTRTHDVMEVMRGRPGLLRGGDGRLPVGAAKSELELAFGPDVGPAGRSQNQN
jgi:hypothetical protein